MGLINRNAEGRNTVIVAGHEEESPATGRGRLKAVELVANLLHGSAGVKHNGNNTMDAQWRSNGWSHNKPWNAPKRPVTPPHQSRNQDAWDWNRSKDDRSSFRAEDNWETSSVSNNQRNSWNANANSWNSAVRNTWSQHSRPRSRSSIARKQRSRSPL